MYSRIEEQAMARAASESRAMDTAARRTHELDAARRRFSRDCTLACSRRVGFDRSRVLIGEANARLSAARAVIFAMHGVYGRSAAIVIPVNIIEDRKEAA